jgi:hypothetical protein
MTRRSSVRALARENYCVLAAKAEAQASEATPTPNPSPQGGGEKNETELTARVRALYEDSAVPVHEIARIAGVTERTIYKYVAKQGWTKRYRVLPRGEAAAQANRGRRTAPSAAAVPVKGAGGRFIRREDADKPVARGLKATDAAGAALALADCSKAAQLAAAAQAKAEEELLAEQRIRAIEATNRAAENLDDYLKERAKSRLQPRGVDWVERGLTLALNIAMDEWEYLQHETLRRMQ